MIQISKGAFEKLMQMVKEGNEVHIELTPDEVRIDVVPWKPFEYKCPYQVTKEGDDVTDVPEQKPVRL